MKPGLFDRFMATIGALVLWPIIIAFLAVVFTAHRIRHGQDAFNCTICHAERIGSHK